MFSWRQHADSNTCIGFSISALKGEPSSDIYRSTHKLSDLKMLPTRVFRKVASSPCQVWMLYIYKHFLQHKRKRHGFHATGLNRTHLISSRVASNHVWLFTLFILSGKSAFKRAFAYMRYVSKWSYLQAESFPHRKPCSGIGICIDRRSVRDCEAFRDIQLLRLDRCVV